MLKNNWVKSISVLLLSAFLLQGCSFSAEPEQGPLINPEEKFKEVFDESTLSYTGKGEEEIQNPITNNETEDDIDYIIIDDIDYNDEFVEEIPVGEGCLVDLNCDGTLDKVYYNAKRSNTAEFGTAIDAFTINDGDYKYTLFLSDQGIHVQDPNLVSYFITDLDTRDRYREVAILDYGANGTPLTYFIRYTGSGTYCLGYVPYFPDDEYFVLKGNGKVESAVNLTILQDWKAPAIWTSGSDQQLSSNLKMYKSDMYYPYDDQNEEDVLLTVDLTVYETRNTSSTKTVIKASSKDPVIFTQTDDKNWVFMVRGEESGWFYMKNKDIIMNNGVEVNKRDVFKNLR